MMDSSNLRSQEFVRSCLINQSSVALEYRDLTKRRDRDKQQRYASASQMKLSAAIASACELSPMQALLILDLRNTLAINSKFGKIATTDASDKVRGAARREFTFNKNNAFN